MKTDIEIAKSCKIKPIRSIAKEIPYWLREQYGDYKAKINLKFLEYAKENHFKDGKLILVTAMTPTTAGEGKTTTTIGLADGLNMLDYDAVVALREPSLGPVFGMKGGATGGGYAQVVPMEDINLHFTGDFHAIESANNLLAAMIDNHIHHGNKLNIDPSTISWKRCVDMNDRQLRYIIDGLGGSKNGSPREDGYDITVASEVMAILCLAESITDLKNRLSKIVIGYNYNGIPITAGDLKAQGAMAALLKDAIKPNLVQTLEGTPAIVHGGPFANIAHGCNSVLATKMALKLGSYVVTEAGFGSDLGAEKFLDIKCRSANIKPDAIVVVATIRALKLHGLAKDITKENILAISSGLDNLMRHVSNMKSYGVPCMVAINKFSTDTEEELNYVTEYLTNNGVENSICTAWENGGAGAVDLADKVVKLCDEENSFKYLYNDDDSIREKVKKIATSIYHAVKIEFDKDAIRKITRFTNLGYGNLPVCIAKTQYSFSDNPRELNAPSDHVLHVRDVRLSAGAGFIVIICGDIMTMPGLPAVPAAENIDVDKDGNITGLF